MTSSVPTILGLKQRAAAKILIACTTAVFLLIVIAGNALARRRPQRSFAANDAGKRIDKALVPFAAECLMEPSTGTVLAGQNIHKPWPTASLAKMMLMLIVARKLHDGSLKLSDRVTTSAYASEIGGSQVYLKEGETFTLDEMMKAVVVHSANDAAVAVAEYVAGSAPAFVITMNQMARPLGLKDTHYYSVDGLPPEPGQPADVSSAYDLAVIARELVKSPDVLRWSSIDTAPFRNGAFILRNSNHLIRTYAGCDGLKTGFYYKAGFNVVATADRGGLRFIAVVLGSPVKSRNFQQAAELMSLGFADYEIRQVARQGGLIDHTVSIRGGRLTNIKPVWASDISVILKRDDSKQSYSFVYSLPPWLSAPIKAGEQIGTGEIVVDGKVQETAPLIAPAAVGQGSLLWRLVGMI